MLNNFWRCTRPAGKLETLLWRIVLWSVRSNPPSVYCWEEPHLEPTCIGNSVGGHKGREGVTGWGCGKYIISVLNEWNNGIQISLLNTNYIILKQKY